MTQEQSDKDEQGKPLKVGDVLFKQNEPTPLSVLARELHSMGQPQPTADGCALTWGNAQRICLEASAILRDFDSRATAPELQASMLTDRLRAIAEEYDNDKTCMGYLIPRQAADRIEQLERELAEAQQAHSDALAEWVDAEGRLAEIRSATRTLPPSGTELHVLFADGKMFVDTGVGTGAGNVAYKVKDDDAKPIMEALAARSTSGASSQIPDGYAEWKLLGIDRRKPIVNAVGQAPSQAETPSTMLDTPAPAAPSEGPTPRVDELMAKYDNTIASFSYLGDLAKLARQLESALAVAKRGEEKWIAEANRLAFDAARSATRTLPPSGTELHVLFADGKMFVDTGVGTGAGNVAYKVKDDDAKPIMEALAARSTSGASSQIPDGYMEWKLLGIERRSQPVSSTPTGHSWYEAIADGVQEVADAASEAFRKAGLEPGEWDGDNIVQDVGRGIARDIERLASRSSTAPIDALISEFERAVLDHDYGSTPLDEVVKTRAALKAALSAIGRRED